MTNDFLAPVLAAPADDLPRLAYADWLDERGDPRAEFVRVQCLLERIPDNDDRWPELLDRERQLLIDHAGEWGRPLSEALHATGKRLPRWIGTLPRPSLWQWWFRRGFVEEVAVPAGNYLNWADPLWANAPVRRLSLTQATNRIDDLAADSRLDRLDGLRVYADYLQDTGCVGLVQVARAAGLRVLSLRSDRVPAGERFFGLPNPEPSKALMRWVKATSYQYYPVDRPALAAEKLLWLFGHRVAEARPWAFAEMDFNYSEQGDRWDVLALFKPGQRAACDDLKRARCCDGELS